MTKRGELVLRRLWFVEEKDYAGLVEWMRRLMA